MEETKQDEQEVLETPEEESEETTEESEETSDESSEEEDIEALKAKAKKADELEQKNKQLYERLKKQGQKSVDGMSQKDVIYLAKVDIHEDDIDEVVEIAKLRKISVADAHKFMSPILKERAEERKTAQATHVKGGQRGSQKDTPEAILSKALKGNLPDTDEGIEKLAEARMQVKLNQQGQK